MSNPISIWDEDPWDRAERLEAARYEREADTSTIAWTTFDQSMNSRSSKSHKVDADEANPTRTLCGARIPEEGNGVEVGNGADYGDGTCKRCEAKR